MSGLVRRLRALEGGKRKVAMSGSRVSFGKAYSFWETYRQQKSSDPQDFIRIAGWLAASSKACAVTRPLLGLLPGD